jgi:hypothetical protein
LLASLRAGVTPLVTERKKIKNLAATQVLFGSV